MGRAVLLHLTKAQNRNECESIAIGSAAVLHRVEARWRQNRVATIAAAAAREARPTSPLVLVLVMGMGVVGQRQRNQYGHSQLVDQLRGNVNDSGMRSVIESESKNETVEHLRLLDLIMVGERQGERMKIEVGIVLDEGRAKIDVRSARA